MSVLSYLENLASNAILGSKEEESIEISINTLRSRLNNYFGNELIKHFKFGSSTRNTILPRKMDDNSDIDYMIVFEDDSYKPQTYLNKIKRFAEYYYSQSEIYQDNPVIVLDLNHIKFELVPALQTYHNGEYKIPDKSNSYNDWIYTSPNEFNQDLTNKNQENNYKIKPTIRLVKYWNALRGHLFISYLKEKDIVDKYFFNCINLKDYFFEYMLSLDNFNYNYQKTIDEVKRAKTIIKKVQELEDNNMPISAENEIKKLLPEIN